MRILANLNVVGTLDLDSVANAGVDTDRFLVQDANGVVRYRTGAEVASDIGSANLAASVLKHQVKLGEAIAKGQAVYVSSSDGTNMIVSKASNTSESTSSKTLGLLETGGALNAQVNVITEGLLAGLDTSTANAGDPVWLGTNGNLIFGLPNKPYAPAHLVFIGIVTRVQQINGEIFIKPQNGFELKEIHDVQITTTPADNTVLSYENSSSLYKMKSIATLLGYTPANAARNITINGTTYDLTADRTWNVGTVTSIGVSVPTGLAVSNTPITGAGTIAISLAAGYSIPTTASQSNWDTAYGWGNHASAGYQVTSQKGQANGYASLDGGGKVPSTQLPSYVDDVLEYANLAGFPGTGETGKIYVALDNNKIYRWSGTAYIEISPTVGTVWGTITGTLSNQTDLQSALDAKVPTSRTITINGTALDLSANRSWTVGDVRTDGSYANPAWITSLAWSKITGAPAFLTASAGTTGTLAKFGASSTLTDSIIREVSGRLLIGAGTTDDSISVIQTNGQIKAVTLTLDGAVNNNTNLWIKSVTGYLGQILYMNNSNMTFALRDNATYWDVYSYVTGSTGQKLIVYANGTIKLPGYTTNGILKTSASDGTLIVDATTYLTGNQTITLSGDATGSGTTSIGVTLANSGVTAGTYGGNNSIPSLVVDAKGRITSASTVTPSGTWGISISGNSATTSQTNFTTLTLNSAAVATQSWVQSQGYLTSVSDVWVNNSGDSMTGNLSFGSSGAGVTWAANTDGASITFESTGDGASGGRALSNLLIALSDNGDEGLKVTTTGTELLYVNTNQFQYKGNTIWHSGNDGSGSGLDADLLDGVSSASFLRSDVVDANLTGTILSTNNANVDGANFEVDTTNKTVNEYAYKVSRSGSAVGGILIDGRGVFASGTTVNGSTVWHQGNLTNLNQLSNGPGYITSYTETDTLASVTSRGSSTTGGITINGTATISTDISMTRSDTTPALVFTNQNGLRWTYSGGGNYWSTTLSIDSNNLINMAGSPLATRSWVTSQGYITGGPFLPLSGGTMTGDLRIDSGTHSLITLGNPIGSSYGGFIQTSDAKRRVFIGANLYDNPSTSWTVPSAGLGSAGISLIADTGGWGTSIDFIISNTGGYNSIAYLNSAGMTVNGSITSDGNIYISNNGGRLYFDRPNGATVGSVGWHTNDVFYVAGHPDYGPTAGNSVRVYGFGADLHLGNSNAGDVITINNSGTINANYTVVATGGSGTTPTLVLNRNIATPSNYYNGLQLEVRATSGTAGIGLHRNGYSHVGIYHDSSNELKFNMNSGTVILPAGAGTLWGSGNLTNLNQLSNGPGYITSSALSSYLPLSGGTMTGDITMSGNGRGIYFTGGNNRIYFGGYRALEGNTTGSQLQVGEGYSLTLLQSTTTQTTNLTVNHVYGTGVLEDGRGLVINGNYTNGQYSHRFRKWDDGGGVPLYLQFTSGTANSWSNLVRFGPWSSDGSYFRVFGSVLADSTITSSSDMRSPQFRFTNSTNNAYLTGASDWGVRFQNDNGWIQIGPANSSYAHIYTDRGSFYFNVSTLYANGSTIWHSGNLTNLNQLSNGPGYITSSALSNYIYTNTGNFTTSGTGWYRVATTGSDGRGTYFVEVYTTGGNHNPSYLKILAHGDWGNDKLVSVETDGGFPASAVRITRGATNTFLEVYFTTTILGASLRVNRTGFDSSVQIYTGALPAGGDTVWDSVSVYSKGYHTPGAVFAKTRMLVGGTDDNSGKADLSVDTAGTATIALAGQYFRVGDSDVNWDLAIRRTGHVETYGQALNLNTQAGNYAVNIRPNNTVVAQYYQDYTYFPGLDFSISRVNSAHASNYFRGSSSHLVIGTGGTLYLNYGNTSGTTYIDGTTYINSAVALHANNYNSYAPTLTGGGASGTWGISINGNADTVDGYHLNQDVRTSGAPSFQYIGVNPSGASNNGYGISLYGGASAGPTYGIFFQGTGTYGTHGSVTGDWATYFTMNNDNSRGWIWRKASTGNVASLSAGGILQVDGDMRAPIFYDSQNTSFYGDFAGTSILNKLMLGNGAEVIDLLGMGASYYYGLGITSAYTTLYSHHQGNGVQLGYYNGTTFTPRLQVSNGGDITLTSGTSGTSGKLIFKTTDNSDTNKYIMQDGYWTVIGTHSNEGLRVRDSAGNILINIAGSTNGYPSKVGIGNTTPAYKLHVSGDIYADGGWLRVSGASGIYFESYGGGWHMTESSYMRAYNGKSVHMNGGSVDYVGSLYLQNGPGVHLQGNTDGSYGSLQITQSKNGWSGIYFTASGNTLMMNSNESGFYRQGYGWQWRWENGTAYVNKNGQGGGTSATVLDSSNYTSYAPSTTGSGASGTWGISINGTASNSNNLGGLGSSAYMKDDGWNTFPGQDANTQPGMSSDFSYSNNAPWTGDLIRFGSGGYSLQLSSQYQGTGLSFRTRNGDNGTWNSWSTVIHSNNIGSQSVSYASSAGNADTVDGYHASNFLGFNGNSYYQASNWIQFNTSAGLYWPSYNGAHIYANQSNYGSIKIEGSRNGWYGIEFGNGVNLMMNTNEVGFHNNNYGWQMRWNDGTIYCHKNSYGGGTSATVLDTSNYSNWAQPKLYQGQSAGDWQNFTNDVGEFRVDEVLNITSGSHSNYPTGVYTYGGVMSWRLNNHSFQLYAAHTGDLAYKTQWGNDNYSGWRRILDSSTYPYAANMNQYVRTSDGVTFANVSANDVYTTGGWFRNHTNNNGVYWSSTGWHLYPADASDFQMRSGANDASIRFMRSDGTTMSYLHTDSGYTMGFLTNSRNWRFYVTNGGTIQTYGTIRRSTHSNGFLEGSYNNIGANDAKTNPIYAIGSSYFPTDTSLSNMYGIGYSHPNFWGSGKVGGWGLYVCSAGVIDAIIGGDGASTSIWAKTDIVAYSDARVKENVEVVENALEKIQSIRGVTFTRNDVKDTKKRSAGVIAQEVLPIFPEVVTGSEEDMYSVAYGNMAALFIEAIKEQQKQIEELKAQINGSSK